MLWLSLYFPDFPMEVREPHPTGSIVIADRVGARRFIISCNDASRDAGVHHGMDVTTALAHVPQLIVIDRSRSQERVALKALAGWAEQFSSCLYLDADRWLLWMEIGGSLNYFGGLSSLLDRVALSIEALGYHARLGTAPTLEAAALLARHAVNEPVLTPNQLKPALASLSLHSLALDANTLHTLQGIGWKTIGEVLDIPRDQLARRFGLSINEYLRRLLGERADVRTPFRAPAKYARRFEFVAPVEATEALLFALRRMLGELQGTLRARDTALQTLCVTLTHHKLPATTLELRTTAPQRDATQLLTLLRERLDRVVLIAPVMALQLSVEQFVPLGDTQLDFFDQAVQRDHSWSTLLDKLRARLGNDAVRRLGLRDEHLPEKAWCVVRGEEQPLIAMDDPHYPERPLWLLEPRRLIHLPKLLGKPERIEGGWREGDDCSRDYFIAETEEGSRWWLYRDALTSHWFLQGLWA